MEEKFFIGIISHKNSIEREKQKKIWENYNDPNLIFYYFIGDINIDCEYLVDDISKTVTLKVHDNYESLSQKTKGIIKFYIDKFSNSTKGILKTDDDINIKPDLLHSMLVENSEKNYYGIKVSIEENSESRYHWGKCESENWNKTGVKIPPVKYCAGGGYFIKNKTAILMKERLYVYDSIIFEDVATGILMNGIEVYPEDINVKSNGLNW
ncbi:hypothetical protein EBS02_01250 [bacterium]|nr:hypothetical protein [bacterium]